MLPSSAQNVGNWQEAFLSLLNCLGSCQAMGLRQTLGLTLKSAYSSKPHGPYGGRFQIASYSSILNGVDVLRCL